MIPLTVLLLNQIPSLFFMGPLISGLSLDAIFFPLWEHSLPLPSIFYFHCRVQQLSPPASFCHDFPNYFSLLFSYHVAPYFPSSSDYAILFSCGFAPPPSIPMGSLRLHYSFPICGRVSFNYICRLKPFVISSCLEHLLGRSFLIYNFLPLLEIFFAVGEDSLLC